MLFRRIRAILVTSILFGVALALGILIVAISVGYLMSGAVAIENVLRGVTGLLTGGAIFGGLFGVVFCAMLMVAERHRPFDQLSRRRVALWGALAGAIVLVGFTIFGALTEYHYVFRLPFTLIETLVMAGLGSAVATAHISIAKRASLAGIAPRRIDKIDAASGQMSGDTWE